MDFLETDRLRIVPWRESDLDDACKLWGDPKVMALIDSRGGLNRQQVQERLDREVTCQKQHGVSYWKAIDKRTSEIIGCCGLRPWAFGPEKESIFEIGFHIGSDHWGKGFATEAAKTVIQFAFGPLGLDKLRAGHHPNNSASRAVLKKLGFVYLNDVLYPPTGLRHPTYELKNLSQ